MTMRPASDDATFHFERLLSATPIESADGAPARLMYTLEGRDGSLKVVDKSEVIL